MVVLNVIMASLSCFLGINDSCSSRDICESFVGHYDHKLYSLIAGDGDATSQPRKWNKTHSGTFTILV